MLPVYSPICLLGTVISMSDYLGYIKTMWKEKVPEYEYYDNMREKKNDYL